VTSVGTRGNAIKVGTVAQHAAENVVSRTVFNKEDDHVLNL
jgi:hypothetical protein